MNIEIITTPLKLNLHGFSGTAVNKDYAGTAFRLSGKMWDVVKSNNLKNKGLNVWVYEAHESVFAGVGLVEASGPVHGLEHKELTIRKYAYYKHVGPYNLIKKSGSLMGEELGRRGLRHILPYIEIYGHWDKDESKQEIELIMAVE